jgi:4-hydroxythreonine-4-phosphate dehydrogenase
MARPVPARIAITPGEPAGIGPDICVLAAMKDAGAQLVAVCDPDLLRRRAERIGRKLDVARFDAEAPRVQHRPGRIEVLSVPLARASLPGRLDPHNSGYVLEALRIACDGCLSGDFDALVTGPAHKGIINDAGIRFTGHTEFLAERCAAQPVMMLTAPGLRVALATTHLPLTAVGTHITPPALERTLRILHRELQEKFAIRQPRIQVCGLNPHAGEGGHLGTEDRQVIAPVLARLRSLGMDLLGPVPADTAFVPDKLEQCDAVLAMYHDQGLPVIKHMGFGRTVNITLGLPIIRTSVDHGTALELAGTGRADCGSLLSALATAIAMACRRAN